MRRVFLGSRRIAVVLLLTAVALGVGLSARAAIGRGESCAANDTPLISNGLVGYYAFNGNLLDSSTSGRHGTASTVSPTATKDRFGRANCAMDFSGASTGVDTGDKYDYQNITVSAWVKSDGGSGARSVASNTRDCCATHTGFHLEYSAAYVEGFFGIWNNNANSTKAEGNAAIKTDRWAHIVGTYDGTNIRYYEDGKLKQTVAYTTTLGTPTFNVTIGRIQAGGRFDGAIDEVMLYNRAVSATEVTTLYTGRVIKAGSGLQNLQGQWKFDSNFNDSSPYRNHGSPIGGPASVADRKGQPSSAFHSNGTSQYVDVANTPSLNSTTGTWSVWIRPTTLPSASAAFMSKHNTVGSCPGISLLLLASGVVRANIKATGACGSGLDKVISSSDLATAGNWHHVALTYTPAGNAELFVNGVSQGTTTVPSGWNFTSEPLRFARATDAFWAYYNGAFDDARIYNKVLTLQEIKSIYDNYQSQISVSSLTKGLVGQWKMDGNAKDATPNRNHGSLVNTPTASTDRKGRASGAYTFNGTNQRISLANDPPGLSFTDNFTLSSWINPTAYHTVGYFNLKNMILAKGPATTYNYGLQVTDATTISFVKRTGAESLQFYNFTGLASLTNKWTLVTAVISGGNVRLYVDGSLAGTQAVGTIAPVAGDAFFIATGGTSETELFFIGSLDDLRVYNRALTAVEARVLYDQY